MRRGPTVSVTACVVGAGIVLLAGAGTWVTVRVGLAGGAAPLGASLSGGTLAPAATAFGLVGLAGAIAVLATRGVGRVATGVLLLAAGIGIVVVAARLAIDPAPAVRGTARVRELAAGGSPRLLDLRTAAWPWLSVAGGVLVAVAGSFVTVRGRSWSAMSTRYETPAARPVSQWDALERGDDPTAGS